MTCGSCRRCCADLSPSRGPMNGRLWCGRALAFQEPLSRVFRSATLPFAAGDKVTLSNLTAEVLEASSEGTPEGCVPL